MPISSDEAISAAMRGVMRTLDDEPADCSIESYGNFIEHAGSIGASVGRSSFEMVMEPETLGTEARSKQIHQAYLFAQALAVTSLLLLAHFPYLEEIDKALPGEERLDT